MEALNNWCRCGVNRGYHVCVILTTDVIPSACNITALHVLLVAAHLSYLTSSGNRHENTSDRNESRVLFKQQ